MTLHTFAYEYWFETKEGETHHALLQLSTTWAGHPGFKTEANGLVAAGVHRLHNSVGNHVFSIRRVELSSVEVQATPLAEKFVRGTMLDQQTVLRTRLQHAHPPTTDDQAEVFD
jgi:hypothetical protein